MEQERLTVGQAPLPNARITAAPTPETYGAGIAQVGQQIGLATYTKAVREANETAVLEASTALARKHLDISASVSEMRGKDAMGAPEYAGRAFQKASDEIQKSLTNDVQRSAYQRQAVARSLALEEHAHHHASQEGEKYQDGVSQAGLDTSRDAARLHASSPAGGPVIVGKDQLDGIGPINTEIGTQRAIIDAWAARKGIAGTDLHQRMLAENLSKTHDAVITGLVHAGKDQVAERYFKANRDEIIAPHIDHVEGMVQEQSYRGNAQRTVQDVVARQLDLGQALEVVSKIDDPKQQQVTRELVKQNFADQALAKKVGQDQRYEKVQGVIDDYLKRNKGAGPFIARNVVPPEEWTYLDAQQKAAVQATIDHNTKPEDRPGDSRLFLDFLALPKDKLGAFSRSDFETKYWAKFSNHDRQRAEGQWDAAREYVRTKKEVGPPMTETVTGSHQIFETFRTSGLVDAHVERGKYNDAQVEALKRFEDQAARAIDAESVAKKRKLTATERQETLNQVRDQSIAKVWTPGTFFGTNQTAAIMVEEGDRAAAFVPLDQIPKVAADKIWQHMKNAKVPVTTDKLQRAYAHWLMNDRKGFDAIVAER